VIDGHGKTLLPGLIDAHGHVLDLGLESIQIQLTGTTSVQEAQQRIHAYAQANPRQAWLKGDGWNQVIWNLGRFPTVQESMLLSLIDRRPYIGLTATRCGSTPRRYMPPASTGAPRIPQAVGLSAMVRETPQGPRR